MSIKFKIFASVGLVGMVIMAGLLAWGFSWKADARFWEGRAGFWQSKHRVLVKEAAAVLVATKKAADNPKLRWEDTPEQIRRLGNSRREWKATALIQTAKVNEAGLETARLKAMNIADRKRAQVQIDRRDKTAKALESRALTPGERSDLARQLREAEEALDLVFQEGL